MSRMPPMLSYYGSKWRIAPRYPEPRHKRIIEPFAGSASYALLYPERDVLLVDRFEKLIAVWQFLIAASPSEILAIPLMGKDQTVDDLPVCQEARWLVGWWLAGSCSNAPCKRFSPRALSAFANDVRRPSGSRRSGPPAGFWSAKCRARIAAAVQRIKHWRAVCASYETIDMREPATWFVDPPYEDKGRHYPHGSRDIDFAALGSWCKGLPGQVIVCENEGATWLPFQPFVRSQSSTNIRKSAEAIWCNDGWTPPQIGPSLTEAS